MASLAGRIVSLGVMKVIPVGHIGVMGVVVATLSGPLKVAKGVGFSPIRLIALVVIEVFKKDHGGVISTVCGGVAGPLCVNNIRIVQTRFVLLGQGNTTGAQQAHDANVPHADTRI